HAPQPTCAYGRPGTVTPVIAATRAEPSTPYTVTRPDSAVRSSSVALTRSLKRVSDAASFAASSASQSSHQSSPTRDARKSTSSLPCGASNSDRTPSPSATGSRSWETKLCRNDPASSPRTTTSPRGERSATVAALLSSVTRSAQSAQPSPLSPAGTSAG